MELTNLVLGLIFLINITVVGMEATQTASNVSNPLIYTRLKYEYDFLQIYKRFQKLYELDERKLTTELTLIDGDNGRSQASGSRDTVDKTDHSSTTQRLVYYENDQVESTNLTLDDLIFEALDRTYLTRLIPAYIHNYDNKEDLARASDPKVVSEQKCTRDLDYLIGRLGSLQEFRQTGANLISAKTHNPELLALFDSIASEGIGVMLGNYHWTGQWVQCNQRQIFDLDRNNPANSIYFKGRYCTASLKSKNWNKHIASRQEELARMRYFKYPGQSLDYARFFRIQLGVCLPESCDSRSLGQHRDAIHKLSTFKLSEPWRSYHLVDLFCLPDEASELRQIEWSGQLWIALAIFWCASVLLATVADNMTVKSSPAVSVRDKLVSSLSLTRNFARFVETDSLKTRHRWSSCSNQSKGCDTHNKGSRDVSDYQRAANGQQKQGSSSINSATKQSTLGKVRLLTERNKLEPNDLLFMNAIKVICMPVIMVGHSAMLLKQLDCYVLHFDGSELAFHFYASAAAFVDWFFVITGFLLTYLMFVTKKVAQNSLLDWLYTLFHRYWRLAPLYLLLFWFTKSVFMYTSHGPLWDYGTSNMTLRGICRHESWIYPLTLTPNFHPLHEECIMPAWYIGNDMQFYIVTPIILVLLYKSSLLGWLVTLGAIGACISLRFHRYWTDSKAQHLELMRPRFDLYMRNNWDMHPTYVYPQYRISAYLIGILAGHYTYMVLTGQWTSPIYYQPDGNGQKVSPPRSTKGPPTATNQRSSDRRAFWSAGLRLLVFLLGVQLLFSMMFATRIIDYAMPVSLEKQAKYFASFVYALSHSTTSLGMALFLTTIMLGQFKWLRSFMSHPNWTILSRINYIAFLIQVELIYWLVQSSNKTIEMNHLELIKLFCSMSVYNYLLSFVLTILVEYPLAQLERQFVGNVFASWIIRKTPSTGVKVKHNPQKEHRDEQPSTDTNESVQLCSPKQRQHVD